MMEPNLTIIRRGSCGKSSDSCLIGIVTQLSIDRIDRLSILCKQWSTSNTRGHIVAAILHENRGTDKSETESSTLKKLKSLEIYVSTLPGCSLQTILVKGIIKYGSNVGLYPINALRNIALEACTTELVLLSDVDCIPTSFLLDDLIGTTEKRSALLTHCWDNYSAVVIPSFEILGSVDSGADNEFGLEYSFSGVQLFQELLSEGSNIQVFMGDRFSRAHRATDYAHLSQVWKDRLSIIKEKTTSRTSHPVHLFPPCYYPIKYEEGFEPYVIIARHYAPKYDPVFSGYGRNKSLHLYHLHRLGFKFVVFADAGLLHLPHAPTTDRIRLLGHSSSRRLNSHQKGRIKEHEVDERCTRVGKERESVGSGDDGDLGVETVKQEGLLKEVKQKYNTARTAITTQCSSWAIDGIHQLPISSSDMEMGNYGAVLDSGCCTRGWPSSRAFTQRSSKICANANTKRFAVGTATAWWPKHVENYAQSILKSSVTDADVYDDEDYSVVQENQFSLSRLSTLCSIHMHYEIPALHIHKYYDNCDYYFSKNVTPVVWLVTHLSVDRLEKLRVLCQSWKGPIAASVWIQSHLSRVERASRLRLLEQLHSDVLTNAANEYKCKLYLVKAENMFVEVEGLRKKSVVINPNIPHDSRMQQMKQQKLSGHSLVMPASASPLSSKMYPVNALRGAAFDVVHDFYPHESVNSKNTEHVMLFSVDVDMRPSDLASAALANPTDPLLLAVAEKCRIGQFVVFPALEVHASASQLMPISHNQASNITEVEDASSKIDKLLHCKSVEDLRAMFHTLAQTSCIRAFHETTYRDGHRGTLTSEWLSAAASGNAQSENNNNNSFNNRIKGSEMCSTAGNLPFRPVPHTEGWEPYGIISLQAYVRSGGINRAFVGWHKDKIDFIKRLSGSGVCFTVCMDPRAFVLDWEPHCPTGDRVRTSADIIYLAAMHGLYKRTCRQLEAFTELSADEAYRDDKNAPPNGIIAPTMHHNDTRKLPRCSSLCTPVRSSNHDNYKAAGTEMRFWRSGESLKVMASAETLGNITFQRSEQRFNLHDESTREANETENVFSVRMESGSMSPPMGGVSFSLKPLENGFNANPASLGISIAVKFPRSYSFTPGGCLPGISGIIHRCVNPSAMGDYSSMEHQEESKIECRGKWNQRGMLSFGIVINSSLLYNAITVDCDVKVQLHKEVWHDIEVLFYARKRVVAYCDGVLLFSASVCVDCALIPEVARVCLFTQDNNGMESSALEIKSISIYTGETTQERSQADKMNPCSATPRFPHSEQPASLPYVSSSSAERIEKARDTINTDTTVIFAPKETHSVGAECLRELLTSYPHVAHIIIVIAPPISVEVEKALLEVSLLHAHAQSSVSVYRADPYQNSYALRNLIVEKYLPTTKYTLHLNNDVFSYSTKYYKVDANCTNNNKSNWLEELIIYAEDNPDKWAIMPLLLEKSKKRCGLHVWWEQTAVQGNGLISSETKIFNATFGNAVIDTPVLDLPEVLSKKLAGTPLLFLEDHCILVQTARFPPERPLFDPHACYRREFFDLAWQVRAYGGEIGISLKSLVVYERVQPLQIVDVPYFLHRRQDELCFISQEYLDHKWRIVHRIDNWHEIQRREAMEGVQFTRRELCTLNTHELLVLLVSFLVCIGANRFSLDPGDSHEDNAPCADFFKMEEFLAPNYLSTRTTTLSNNNGNSDGNGNTTVSKLRFIQHRVERADFKKEISPTSTDIATITGLTLRSDLLQTTVRSLSPPEECAFGEYALIHTRLHFSCATPPKAYNAPVVWDSIVSLFPYLLEIASVVLSMKQTERNRIPCNDDDKVDREREYDCLLMIDAYVWVKGSAPLSLNPILNELTCLLTSPSLDDVKLYQQSKLKWQRSEVSVAHQIELDVAENSSGYCNTSLVLWQYKPYTAHDLLATLMRRTHVV